MPSQCHIIILAIRGSKPGALFLTEEGRVLTHPQFSAALTSIIEDVGLLVKEFNMNTVASELELPPQQNKPISPILI